MNVTINKANLKDGLFLKGDYDEKINDAYRNSKFDDSHAIHEDLFNCFLQLAPHLMRLCEQFDPSIDNLQDCMHCTGFKVGGSGSTAGITLIGYRTLSDGRVLDLKSPFLQWENDNYEYPDIEELKEIIDNAKSEVILYLFEGKHAPDKQLSLFPEEPASASTTTVTFIAGGDGEKTIPLDEFVDKTKKATSRKKKKETSNPDGIF